MNVNFQTALLHFFERYHYWQPQFHQHLDLGIKISYMVWKKQHVILGIIIHCTINILGAVSGYLVASGDIYNSSLRF